MSETSSDESPEKRPAIPGASPVNGQVPPEHARFQKGNKGGPGRPRGAWPRAALARKLAKGWDSDEDADDPEHRIGVGARDLADKMIEAALLGDMATVKACAEIINQVEGKPQEHVDHSGDVATVHLVGFDSPEDEPVTGGIDSAMPSVPGLTSQTATSGYLQNAAVKP